MPHGVASENWVQEAYRPKFGAWLNWREGITAENTLEIEVGFAEDGQIPIGGCFAHAKVEDGNRWAGWFPRQRVASCLD
jgi:hypothetical protein